MIATTEEDTEKTRRQLLKHYNTYAWAWGDIAKECINDIWKKVRLMALKRFVYDFKGFAKDVEVAEIISAAVEMAKSFTLGVYEDKIKELLKWFLRNR